MMQRDALQAFSPPGPRESIATIGRILLLQTMAGLLFSAVAFLLSGNIAGSSTLIGVAVCLLPNLLFALRVMPGLYQVSPKRVMNGFYTAETIKIAVTVLLFVLVFRFVAPLRVDLLFAGFITTQLSIILAAWITD